MAAKDHIPSLDAWVGDLQAAGRYTFTLAEASAAGKRSAIATQTALRRMRQSGRIASPRRGFHVIVPLEYRSAACPPASWFIDDFMRALGKPYYVGILSAAALHGAAHQQPMVFHVVTPFALRPALAGRNRIEFHRSSSFEQTPTLSVRTETGSMRVATPEATAYDLVRFPEASGHLDNVATVLSELTEKLDGQKLLVLASAFTTPDVQRLGYLLEHVGERELAAPLEAWLREHRVRPVPLDPSGPTVAVKPDRRWRIILNQHVEADR